MTDMRIRVIVWVPFNRFDTAQRTDPAWYAERRRLWRMYTQRSLLRQRCDEFECWIVCQPEFRMFSDGMGEDLAGRRFRIVYDPAEAAAELPEAERYVLIRLDSDDMIDRDALCLFHRNAADVDPAGKRAFIQLGQGWIWHEKSNDLYEWNNPSPPFFARVHGPDFRQSGDPHFGHHGRVHPRAKQVLGRHFLVVIHGGNLRNRMRPGGRWQGRQITGAEKQKVLAEYEIADEVIA